jgi:hypothetical protein
MNVLSNKIILDNIVDYFFPNKNDLQYIFEKEFLCNLKNLAAQSELRNHQFYLIYLNYLHIISSMLNGFIWENMEDNYDDSNTELCDLVNTDFHLISYRDCKDIFTEIRKETKICENISKKMLENILSNHINTCKYYLESH